MHSVERSLEKSLYLALLLCLGAGLGGPYGFASPGDSQGDLVGYTGDPIILRGEFPRDARVTIAGRLAEALTWRDDHIIAYVPENDPGEHLVQVQDGKGSELARFTLLHPAGSVDDPDDPAGQRPIISGLFPATVSAQQENPTVIISGLYFAHGNPEEMEVLIGGLPVPVIGTPTTYRLTVPFPSGLTPDGPPIPVTVVNRLNGKSRTATVFYTSQDPDEGNLSSGPAACGSIRLTPTRGLLGSKVSLTLGNPPADFEPELRFEYDGTSRRVIHCNRVGNRWDYNVPDIGLTGPTRVRARVANCPEGPSNPLAFDLMVPPELQGNPPLTPAHGPSGTAVEIQVKNMAQFRTHLLLSEVLLSSADGGLWTQRFRAAQICLNNSNCPVNVQAVDEGAGLYKVQFRIPRESHPGRVNISLYYAYTPCGTEVRTAVSLPPVSFIVDPPADFTMRITDPPDRPIRRVVVHGNPAPYTVTLRNNTSRPLLMHFGLMAISMHGVACRLLDGDQSLDCSPSAAVSVPPGEKNITLRLDTGGVSRTRATIEFRLRGYSEEIGALLEPPTDRPDGDPDRWPARLIIQPTAGPNLLVKMTDPGPPNYQRVTCQGGEADYELELDNIGDRDLENIRLEVEYLRSSFPAECRFTVEGREGAMAPNCSIDNLRIGSGDPPKTVKLRFSTRAMESGRNVEFRIKATSAGETRYAPPSPAMLTTSYPCQSTFAINPPTQSRAIGQGERTVFDYSVEGVAGFGGEVQLSITKVEKCVDAVTCAGRQLLSRSLWEGSVFLSRARVTLPPAQPLHLTVQAPFTLSHGRFIITLLGQSQGIRREFYAHLTVGGPQAYYIPQIADGRVEGWSIRTTFVLVNPGAETTARLELTDDLGNPLTVRIPRWGSEPRSFFAPIRLPRGGTVMLETDGGNATLQTGGAVVTAEGNIGVSVIYAIYGADGKLRSHAGVLSSALLPQFTMPVLRSSAPNPVRQTGLALFNPTHQSASVTLSLYTEGGGAPYKTVQFELPPRHHRARFIHESPFFPLMGPNFKGTVGVVSTAPIAAVALLIDDLLLAAVPRVAIKPLDAQSTLYLPHVADGTGADGHRLKTTFLLSNTQAQSADVTIRLTGDSGGPYDVTLNGTRSSIHSVRVPPGGAAFLESDGLPPLTSGAATLTATVPVSASLLYSLYDSRSGATLSMAGVLDAPPLRSLTLPVDYSQARSVGLALFNPDERPISLTLRLIDGGGTLQATRTRLLERRNHVSAFLRDPLFGFDVGDGFQGSLAITCDDNRGVSAVGLNVKDDQMATLPVIPGAASPP